MRRRLVLGVAATIFVVLQASAAAGGSFDRPGGVRSAYALSFDGSDSSVTANDSPSLQIERANAFTVAFWAYARQFDNNPLPRFWEKNPQYLCIMGDRTNPMFGRVGLEVQNASGTGNTNGGATEFWGSTKLQTNMWYFIAVTFDGSKSSSQAQIYLNGVPEQMRVIYPWSGKLYPTAGRPWLVGRRLKDLARGLDGVLRSLVVYPTALSGQQVQSLYVGRYPPGLVADWELDEGQGTVARDSSGKSNNGTIANGVYVAR
jgi:hypothetical protein